MPITIILALSESTFSPLQPKNLDKANYPRRLLSALAWHWNQKNWVICVKFNHTADTSFSKGGKTIYTTTSFAYWTHEKDTWEEEGGNIFTPRGQGEKTKEHIILSLEVKSSLQVRTALKIGPSSNSRCNFSSSLLLFRETKKMSFDAFLCVTSYICLSRREAYHQTFILIFFRTQAPRGITYSYKWF